FVSSLNNNSTNGAINTAQTVNTAIGVSTARTQVNTANIDNLSDAVICAFLASQPSSPQLGVQSSKKSRYQAQESIRRTVPVETPASTALVSCDGLGRYDWSDQVDEGLNYALMAYTSTSSDSKIVDNYKKGYDKFAVKPVVENKSSKEESKAVRKNPDALNVED
nr:hypothetical protein [Tanacetum cinerariifolium]